MIGLRALSNGSHTLEHPDGFVTVRVVAGSITSAELLGRHHANWPVFDPRPNPTVHTKIIPLWPRGSGGAAA